MTDTKTFAALCGISRTVYFSDNGPILAAMLGKTPTKIEQFYDEEINFHFGGDDPAIVTMYHKQDCCEDVNIEDVTGDLQDLVGHPLLVADERINIDNEEAYESNDYTTSTWTFYTFRSIGGSVDIKWHGSSNGYYSEAVNMRVLVRENK